LAILTHGPAGCQDATRGADRIRERWLDLAGVKVYKLGDEPEKPVYVVGKAADGRWGRVKTTVVET
jgi:hypothetical protein